MNRFLAGLGFIAAMGASTAATAGCLNGTHAGDLKSKVRGIYAIKPSAGAHYIYVDKQTCTTPAGGTTVLGSATKTYGALRINDNDKFIMSTLLAAQGQGLEVKFVLSAPNADNYNEIVSVISPSNANEQ